MLISNNFYMLLVQYMYSLVVLVVFAFCVAMVKVGYILSFVSYLHEPQGLACRPQSCKERSKLHLSM